MNSFKKKINRLEILTKILKKKKDVYQPSIFWKKQHKKFYRLFLEKKLGNFRNDKLANNFFVPLYHLKREWGSKTILKLIKKKKISNRLSIEINKLLSGYYHAEKDYKIFSLSDIKKKPYLHKFSESKFGNPAEHFYFDKKYFSRSALNYLKGLTFLKIHTKNFIPKIILEIGGGYGTLGEIFKFSGIKNFKYINIDLPPISNLSEIYLERIYKKENISEIDLKLNKNIYIKNLKKITCLNSWQIEQLKGEIDLFVNFISFQEMEPDLVKNYLSKVCNLKPRYILMRNLREGKQKFTKNSIGVKKPVRSSNYINYLKKNYILVNKNTVDFGYLTYDNFHSELLLFKKK
jgi:putative sugar O-methyltransferase